MPIGKDVKTIYLRAVLVYMVNSVASIVPM